MPNEPNRTTGQIKAVAVSITGFFIATALVSLFGVVYYGKLRLETESHLARTVLNLTSLVLPILVPYAMIKVAKKRTYLGSEYPENAVGGMAVGLGAIFWISAAMMAAAEYERPVGPSRLTFLIWVLTPVIAAMSIGAFLAIRYLKRNRVIALVVAAPLIAVGSFSIGALSQRHPEQPKTIPSHVLKAEDFDRNANPKTERVIDDPNVDKE